MPPFKSEKDKPFSDWPSVGEVLVDRRGDRRLRVTNVDTKSRIGRHIQGVLLGDVEREYSCDVPTLLIQWDRPN